MNHMWKRLLVTVLVVGSVALTDALPAWAAVPSNDTEEGAVVIDTVPFTHESDTTEATPGGPDFCPTSASVFYRFTPAEDVRVQVDLLGSDYDTTLALYTRDPDGQVEPLVCSDDRIGYAGGVRVRAVAGTTYYFMAGRCCGNRNRSGGQLVLTVSEVVTEPLETTLEISDTGTVDPETGIATISGAVTCNKRSYVYWEGALRQLREELFLARGYWWGSGTCTPEAPLEWSAEVDTETSVVFGPGAATLRRSYVSSYAGWRDWEDDDDDEDVTVAISLV